MNELQTAAAARKAKLFKPFGSKVSVGGKRRFTGSIATPTYMQACTNQASTSRRIY